MKLETYFTSFEQPQPTQLPTRRVCSLHQINLKDTVVFIRLFFALQLIEMDEFHIKARPSMEKDFDKFPEPVLNDENTTSKL